MGAETADDLVRQGRLEAVAPDPGAARARMEEARRHLESAEALAASDASGAYALLYDAARKAVTAHMLANGYRASNRPGAHVTVVRYAEIVLGAEPAFDRMRRNRNRSEYGVRAFGAAEVATDLQHARKLVAEADSTL